MNDSDSGEQQNEDYEKERVEINKAILSNIQDFIAQAVWTSGGTVFLAVLYIVFTCCKTDVKNCIKETGTAIPLFIVISAILVDWGFRIMRLAVGKWTQWKDEREQRDEKLRAEGAAKVINALPETAKSDEERRIIAQAVETYKAQNGNTDN